MQIIDSEASSTTRFGAPVVFLPSRRMTCGTFAVNPNTVLVDIGRKSRSFDTCLVPELNGSFDAIGADERIRVVLSNGEEIVLRG